MSVAERMVDVSNRFYLRIRHPDAWAVSADLQADLESLRGHKYCLLTTFRQSGEAVPTPVWFGIANDKVYVRSESWVGKVKRIRANGRALVGPCTMRGKPLGPMVEGRARVLPAEEEDRAEAALAANYGLGRRLFERTGERFDIGAVYLEISPTGGSA